MTTFIEKITAHENSSVAVNVTQEDGRYKLQLQINQNDVVGEYYYAPTIEKAREVAMQLITDWYGFEPTQTEPQTEIAVENDAVYVVESGKASNGQIIRAYADYRDYADEPYIIRWHAGEMPAHHTESFEDKADFVTRMTKIANLADWQICEEE